MLREHGAIFDDLSRIADVIILSICFLASVWIYSVVHDSNGSEVEQGFLIFLVYILCWIFTSDIYRVYQSRRFMTAVTQIKRLVEAHLSSLVITVAIITLYDPTMIQNRFILYFELIALTSTCLMHLSIRLALQAFRSVGKNTRYILILGSGKAASTYLSKVKNNPQLGYQIVGYLAPERNGLGIPYLGDYANLETVLNEKIVDLTVITAPLSDKRVKECIELLDIMGKGVTILLEDIIAKVRRSRTIDFDGLPMVAYDGRPRRPAHELIKRTMDVIFSGLGLLVISPILVLIAVLIKISSKGPVLFVQERVGYNGRIFKMYKFRSMVVNAEELKDRLVHLNEMSGPVFKITNDPRITPIGRFLRKTSLDELPQLWNVFLGEMSLVGPRPPLPSEVNMYDPKHRKRLAVKPGITCIWQISGRNEVDFEEWMEMDLAYVDQWSLKLDVEILAKTVPVVLMRKGAS